MIAENVDVYLIHGFFKIIFVFPVGETNCFFSLFLIIGGKSFQFITITYGRRPEFFNLVACIVE